MRNALSKTEEAKLGDRKMERENETNPRSAGAGVKTKRTKKRRKRGSRRKQGSQAEAGIPVQKTDHLTAKELNKLGWSRIEAYRQFGRLDDIEEAIEYGVRALCLTPYGHPDLPRRLNLIGVSYEDRFRRSGKLEDIQETIECFSRALASTSDGDPDLSVRNSNLGIALGIRYLRLGELGDLEESLKYKLRAFELTPDGGPDLPDRHAHLGACYGYRFQRLGEIEDLKQALEHFSCSLALTPRGHEDLPSRHANIGACYTDRFQRLGELGDLEQALKHELHALALTLDGHPHLSDRYTSLGMCYNDRFHRLGEFRDLEEAIEHLSRALEFTPNYHPDLALRHANLGASYGDRFQRLGEVRDLERALELDSRALQLTPDFHPDLALRHASLGVSYNDRFQRLGELGDLEKAIEHYSQALALTPNDYPDLSDRYADLGVSYNDRFQRLGELEDLELAFENDSRALELTPGDHPDLPHRHASLGVCYNNRFQRLGELGDLEQALENKCRALALTPDGHPGMSRRHADLGESYRVRFQRLGNLEDLELALEHDSRALELTPDRHSELSSRHASLGASHTDRFQRLNELGDLEHAIKHKSHALALTPDDHPDLPDRYADLGMSYADRFRHSGEISDLEKANAHHSHALELTPEGHPDLPRRHFHQALAYFRDYEHTPTPLGLQQSLHHFRKACRSSTGTPRLIFGYASEWAKLACESPALECIEAYQATIELLPQFIWLGATTNTRYQDLAKAESLAINAAFAAIRYQNYPLALEWLEHARCVVWNQSLMLRSPLDRLYSSHPDLASRLQTTSNQLQELSHDLSGPQMHSSAPTPLEQTGRRRRRLAQEYHNLLSEARTLPGFEDFLQPVKANRLMRAAKSGPIVVINCHSDRCDALIIIPRKGDIKHLPLPDFNSKHARDAYSELESSLMLKGLRQRGVTPIRPPGYKDRIARVLRNLWAHVIEPIVNFMGLRNEASAGKLPHITWCPTGVLSFLPWHAAGDYSQPGLKLFDYAISSYTPTLTALSLSTPSTLHQSSRVLAIGQATTPGHSPLPGTTGELESLKGHIKNKAEYAQLIDSQATTAVVLGAMESHDWVHLACHAHQNVDDPTKSGFYLHDGTLDLASINRRSFRNKGLAFLSACQTATGDEKLPDEAVHLASGMLMAGYPSVIATMWSVMDSDAPFVADKVYAELMKEGRVGNGEAGEALHYAIAALRERVGEKEFGRWVPYIHIGSYTNEITNEIYEYRERTYLRLCPSLAEDRIQKRDDIYRARNRDKPLTPRLAGAYTGRSLRLRHILIYPTLTVLLVATSITLNPSSRALAIGQANTPNHRHLPGTAGELESLNAHTRNKVEFTELMDSQATTTTVLGAMADHDWVHLPCHAHQNVDDPMKSGFYLHSGTLHLSSINRRSFRNKGLAYLSACQTATGDKKHLGKAIHLASGMLMAGYSSVIATMWSVLDSDAPFVADKFYAETMEDGKLGNREAG